MAKIILMRHGLSVWNEQNLFTGWIDVPLSEAGIREAIEGGKKMKDLPVDIIFTSTLVRAQMTLALAMLQHSGKKVPVFLHQGEGKQEQWEKIYGEVAQKNTIPVYRAWQLNERMYGQLQGLNKTETAQKFGSEQVHLWRRSFDVAPPGGESLEMTLQRAVPYFEEVITPHLRQGKNVFICAHGNSLRAIMMHLQGMTRQEVVKLEVATGDPIVLSAEKFV